MRKKTRQAILAAELHWLENERGFTKSFSSDDCALCAQYNNSKKRAGCNQGCPVWLATGLFWCAKTPYQRLLNHIRSTESSEADHIGNYGEINTIGRRHCSALCREEKEFLHSLLSWRRFLHKGYVRRVLEVFWNSLIRDTL